MTSSMDSWQKYLLSGLLLVSGVFHFLKTELYLKIMPPYLPYPRELVYVSGTAAIVLGLMFFWRKTSRIASWGTILFLIAVFPANVHMVLHPESFPEISPWIAWARLPLQGLLIYWAYKSGRMPSHAQE